MRAFAEAYPDEELVQEVLALISWYHNIALLEKLKSPEERLWYVQQTIEYGWSRNVLVEALQGNLPTIEQLEAELQTFSIDI